jgi:prolipoprotein diacylglyceryltransferase
VLDLAAVGGAVALAFERAGEYFTTQGLGEYIMDEAWCRFPFAVESVYGDWQIPVFMYEALAAAVIAVVLVCMVNRKPAGRSAEAFIILLGVTQIILESLREDEFIRFGFVRLNMLAAAITMGLAFFWRIRRAWREHTSRPWQIIRLAVFALGIVLVILIEFALDKSDIDDTLLYFVMAGMLGIMGFAMLCDGRKKKL